MSAPTDHRISDPAARVLADPQAYTDEARLHEKLAHLRAVILAADPGAIEEVKWKKPSKPSGVPVWSHNGILCVADTLKRAVRLTFPKGAQIDDPHGMFNKRLDSKTVRAIDFTEGEVVSITDGPFKGFDGAISEIDTQKGKIRVMVSMFGRDTPVELDALQVKKV